MVISTSAGLEEAASAVIQFESKKLKYLARQIFG